MTDTSTETSTPNTEPTNPTPAAQPKTAQQPAQKAATEQQPKPVDLGREFAALDRKQKTVKQYEQQLRQREEQLNAREGEFKKLETMSADELIEYAASKRGSSTEDIIKNFIAKKTGQPTGEEAIKGSKDPAVQALNEQLAAEKREREALLKKLEEKEKSEAEARAQANVQMVRNECLQSAAAVWQDGSDYEDFFDDKPDLADAVLSYCADRVAAYEKEHGFSPDDEDIQKLISAAPALLLNQLKGTPRGKRIMERKAATLQAKPELSEKASKPSMVRMKPVPKGDEQPRTQQPIKTRYDNSEAIERARAMLPERLAFGSGAKSGNV